MSDHNEPFDGDETLHKDEVHEENKQNQHQADDHQNSNPGLSKGRNPIHHNAGGR